MALTKIDDRGLKTPIDLLDSEKIRLGTDNDLELYSDGTDSYISHKSGDLYLYGVGDSDDIYIWAKDDIHISPQDGENGIKVIGNGAVELYWDSLLRLSTKEDGVQLRGGSTKEHWCEGHYFPWTNATYDIGGTAASDGSVYYWRDGLFSRNLILRGDSGEFRVEAANGVDAFTVDSDNGNTYIGGNLGIGVTPSRELHVKGLDAVVRLESTAADGRNWIEFYDSSAGKGSIGYPSSSNNHLAIQQDEAADLYFYVNGGERMRIDSDGHVGIKEPSPGRQLTVKGGAHFGFEGTNSGYPYLGDTPVVAISTDGNDGSATSYADKAILLVGRGGGGLAGTTYGGVGVTTELFRVDMGGDVKLLDGDLRLANTHGINFSAVSDGSRSVSSNVLADYEEGSFSPTLSSGGTSISYSEQLGYYRKIGKTVFISVRMQFSCTTNSALFSVGGLPFTSSAAGGSNYTSGGITYCNVPLNSSDFDPYIGNNVTYMSFYEKVTGNSVVLSSNANNNYIGVGAFYFTDS